MPITRVSDAQRFDFLTDHANELAVSISDLNQQIATGKRLTRPDQDPLGSAQVVRAQSSLAALGQYDESTRFGQDVLGAQHDALSQAIDETMARAKELAADSSILSPDARSAASHEVDALLQSLTAIGNSELAGRRLFGGLALDGPAPFADPLTPGYTAATAYSGSAAQVSVKIGSGSSERVQISTSGDQTFTSSLQALTDLKAAFDNDTPRAPSLDAVESAIGDLEAERARVDVRASQLKQRGDQVAALTVTETAARSHVQDADLVAVISRLSQAQTALQALLAAGAQLSQTNLTDLLQI